MSTTLSYGYVRPANGDTGATFWDQLANDITQLNAHTHNGSDSALIPATSITPVSQTVLAGAAGVNWGSPTAGLYSRTITVPASIDYDVYGMIFRVASGSVSGTRGDQLNLSFTRLTDTTYTLYCNHNLVDLDILYLV